MVLLVFCHLFTSMVEKNKAEAILHSYIPHLLRFVLCLLAFYSVQSNVGFLVAVDAHIRQWWRYGSIMLRRYRRSFALKTIRLWSPKYSMASSILNISRDRRIKTALTVSSRFWIHSSTSMVKRSTWLICFHAWKSMSTQTSNKKKFCLFNNWSSSAACINLKASVSLTAHASWNCFWVWPEIARAKPKERHAFCFFGDCAQIWSMVLR